MERVVLSIVIKENIRGHFEGLVDTVCILQLDVTFEPNTQKLNCVRGIGGYYFQGFSTSEDGCIILIYFQLHIGHFSKSIQILVHSTQTLLDAHFDR